jgi:hypothetical protein
MASRASRRRCWFCIPGGFGAEGAPHLARESDARRGEEPRSRVFSAVGLPDPASKAAGELAAFHGPWHIDRVVGLAEKFAAKRRAKTEIDRGKAKRRNDPTAKAAELRVARIRRWTSAARSAATRPTSPTRIWKRSWLERNMRNHRSCISERTRRWRTATGCSSLCALKKLTELRNATPPC